MVRPVKVVDAKDADEVPVSAENVAVPPKAGARLKTDTPVPVSPVTAVANCAVVNEPNDAALPTDVMAPVKLALVVTEPAVNPEAVPVMLVPMSADGVPRFGVVRTGEVENTATPVPVSSVRELSRVAESAVVVARD